MSTAVVIGAGADALVAAHTLARRGVRVVVVDEAGVGDRGSGVGGAALDVGWVPPRVVRELGLHDLTVERPDPWIVAPLPGGERLELWRDVRRSVEAIRRLSPRDAERWPAYCERMHRLAGFLASLYAEPAPDLLGRDLGELVALGRLGLRARRLGRQGLEDLLRTLPMSAWELLDDWFEHDALKGILGAAGVAHLCQGPRSGGTAFVMLHHHVGSEPGVFRPPRSNLSQVLRTRPGVEVRGGPVERITVRDGAVAGVALSSGEEIAAAQVLSAADPARTLIELVDPGWLGPELVNALRHARRRGVVATVRLTLERRPGVGALTIAPSLAYLERAYDDAKYGRMSERPYVEVCADGASGGRPALELHVQYAPYRLREGAWDDQRRRALGEAAVATLCEHEPELRGAIADVTVHSPVDLEREQGWPEGQAFHVEPALDQILFMRPVPGLARYRTPIRGLYLCGPGTHPGGRIVGASGALAADAALRDGRR